MRESDYVLSLRHISKSFPGVKALDDVCIDVRKGTTHILIGENGAGKSTLMKILDGIYRMDEGSILLEGKEVKIENPKAAFQMGISMIHQELNFFPDMTAEQYFFLENEPQKFRGWVDWKTIREKMTKLLKEEGVQYKAYTRIRDLSVSDLQLLEIMKATYSGAKIIIMDEPTSAVSEKDAKRLFEKIEKLKAKGVTVIYISHKMDEIFEIGDYITVLRDGKTIETRSTKEFTRDEVIELMVGRPVDHAYPKEQIPIGEVLFEAKDFTAEGKFHDVNFHICRGEIVGFAGLVGAGRTEVMRAVVGLDSHKSGQLIFKGKSFQAKNIADAGEQGILMASEDRRRYGCVAMRSVQENIALPNLKHFSRFTFIRHRQEGKECAERIKELNVKTPSLKTLIVNLSGGNQQKVILARILVANPDLLILDEPTRGIDVGAKYEIYKIMTEIARHGVGIIMVSSELPELIGMCDRMYVMREGTVAGELAREEMTQTNVMRLAAN
ncbi:MAG: sugar ABC transporter ATP-binding protein [Eubacteriales bacterium]|nr:sugar ABC transporter ATP-binding protein [Eubacteriales bacterium]